MRQVAWYKGYKINIEEDNSKVKITISTDEVDFEAKLEIPFSEGLSWARKKIDEGVMDG